MFLRGSRRDRERARRGEAQGHPRGDSGLVCGGGFFGLDQIVLEMVFGRFCGYEKAPGPPGRKNLYFLIKILIKPVFKFERRIFFKKINKILNVYIFFYFFRKSVQKLRKKYYFWL